MPKGTKKTARRASTRTISPFRNINKLEKEITSFMNRHKATVAAHAKRMSTYFEMACFNHIVRFYKAHRFSIVVENLQDKKYRYKFSTNGNQENFSHFKVIKTLRGTTFTFAIYHNLAVQSSHEPGLYTTPDISVIQYGTIQLDPDHYESNRKHYYVAPANLVTFFEAKHYAPFPELLFNFMGTVNELMHYIMTNTHPVPPPGHLAPGLLISGKPNKHITKIKLSLEKRYSVNIIYDVLATIGNPFSTRRISQLHVFRPPRLPDRYVLNPDDIYGTF